MIRREFITLIGGAAAWPQAVWAQQAAMPVIGFLSSETADKSAQRLLAFREGLSDLGYVEGHNVTTLYRWADGQVDRLPGLAEDLVRQHVSVLAVVSGVPAIRAAKVATTAIPIVFQTAGDPVKLGFVNSLSRPGGNITGVTSMSMEVGPKRLELMHELLPNADSMALLVNPVNADVAQTLSTELLAASQKLGLRLRIFEARSESDFDTVFTAITKSGARAVVIGDDALFNIRGETLGTFARRFSLPAIFQYRGFVASGGLMSYGGSITESPRKVGVYTGRILKGEKPWELPVQQGTKFDLIISLKTATALGVTVPLPLLARADEIIE